MIVDGKLVTYDLSRFHNCTIKRAALCDLMQIPDFVAALETENGFEISDRWVAENAKRICDSYRAESGSVDRDRRKYYNLARHAVRACRQIGLYE